MKKIITILLVCFSISAIGQEKQLEFDFNSLPLVSTNTDYKTHFIYGAAIDGLGEVVTYYFTGNEKLSKAVGLGAALVFGVTKELIDDRFDTKDLGYTMLGGIMMSATLYISFEGFKKWNIIIK